MGPFYWDNQCFGRQLRMHCALKKFSGKVELNFLLSDYYCQEGKYNGYRKLN